MKLFELIQKHTWEEIQYIFPLYEPEPRKKTNEYQEAYHQLQNLQYVLSDMTIFLEEEIDDETGQPNIDERTGRFWVHVTGKNGKRWKDQLSSERGNQIDKSITDREIIYGLCYVDWGEYLGMEIALTTLEKYSEKEIVLRCLLDMTRFWHSKEGYENVIKEIKAIRLGISEAPMRKKEKQFKESYQIWNELPDGTYHGIYMTYWGSGPVNLQQQGIIINGEFEGIWTHWDIQGTIYQQVRYFCDRPIEVKKEPPWWSDI
jgi:hypothetical protein